MWQLLICYLNNFNTEISFKKLFSLTIRNSNSTDVPLLNMHSAKFKRTRALLLYYSTQRFYSDIFESYIM